MHPYYGPSEALSGGREPSRAGLVSMAAYLAFWAVAIPVTVKLLVPHLPGPTPDSAVAILRDRYARGEITLAELREMRAGLERADRDGGSSPSRTGHPHPVRSVP